MVLITFISFVLQFALNKYLYDTIFIPLCVLVTLVVVEPYFIKHKKNYFVYAIFIGLLYDFIYTNTFFLNTVIFCLLAYVVKTINHNIANNLIKLFINIVSIVILYRVIFYLLYLIIGVVSFDVNILLKGILDSLLFNIFYGGISYYFMTLICKHKNI